MTVQSTFSTFRSLQATLRGRPLTPTDHTATDVILKAATLAMQDVADNERRIAFRVVSLPTGAGKTQGALAFMAAGYTSDPTFTAAYIVPTIRLADEAADDLEALAGPGSVTVYSTAHAPDRDEAAVKLDQGYLPARVASRETLKDARLIIVTHALWLREMQTGRDYGVRHHQGVPRRAVFVDETPDLVKIIETRPESIQALHDRAVASDSEHPWGPLLAGIVSRMNAVMHATGQTYAAVELVSPDDGERFRRATVGDLRALAPAGTGAVEREREVTRLVASIRFLVAASAGCVFYSRLDRSFFAYELAFTPGPGHVLLDATADLTATLALMKGMAHVEAPPVDYGRLEVRHVEHPKDFRRVDEVVKRKATATAYAEWIRSVVLEQTQPGDEVLVVAHKKLYDHEYLQAAEDPERPALWDGRRVNTLHWGVGVGSNRYRGKTHVLLFSEFYPPRWKTIAEVHGLTGLKVTDAALKGAEGRPTEDDEYLPSGPYLTAFEGHLLRWTKQLAARGTVRTIDGDGRCAPMILVTTMRRSRLLQHLARLFPGARPPRLLGTPKGDGETPQAGSQAQRLIRLLGSTEATLLGADEVERETGVKQEKLGYFLRRKALRSVCEVYGWSLVGAPSVGKTGRMRYLARRSQRSSLPSTNIGPQPARLLTI